MTLDEMIEALENGPVDYGPDDDRVLIPVQVANKIAAALRADKEGRAMTNKQERFLVMSEAEFEAALDAAYVRGLNGDFPNPNADMDETESACRAREVPEGVTHFYMSKGGVVRSGDWETPLGVFMEIKK